MMGIFGYWGRLGGSVGHMWVWREHGRVVAGGESAGNGGAFGVEREIGGRRGL